MIVVVGVLLAMLIPWVGNAREAARRMQCTNNIKQIGLALHAYVQANKVFPPGTICATDPIAPHNQYDVWGEAAKMEPGFHGTSFLLRILPYAEQSDPSLGWDFAHGVAPNAPVKPGDSKREKSRPDCGASVSFSAFYCPSRRIGLRREDHAMMLAPWWKGGGTDYGGCAGRHAAFTLETGYNLCDATMYYEPNFFPTPFKDKTDDTEKRRWGIFGRVNVSTKFIEILDGTSNTIMTGELQRISTITPGSKDGWAIGGPATLFTTGAMATSDDGKCRIVAQPTQGSLMNNGFWGSPGSDHSGGANYGLADGSVRFLSTTMDPNVFALMGSMDDRTEASPE